jgi:hypothetical protein
VGVAENRTVKNNVGLGFAAVVEEDRVLDANVIVALTGIGEGHGKPVDDTPVRSADRRPPDPPRLISRGALPYFGRNGCS